MTLVDRVQTSVNEPTHRLTFEVDQTFLTDYTQWGALSTWANSTKAKKSHRDLFDLGPKSSLHPPSAVGKHNSHQSGAPKGGKAQNFALFFPFSRRNCLSFFPLLGVLSWNFGGV